MKATPHKKPINSIWCYDCELENKDVLKLAKWMVMERAEHYYLEYDASSNKRLFGVCEEHLECKNDFQRKYKLPIDTNHPNLFRRYI